MKKTKYLRLSLAFALAAHASHALSNEYQAHAYIGAGSSKAKSVKENDETPWSIGYVMNVRGGTAFWGVDFAKEGTSLNNTSGQNNTVDQGMSINFSGGKTFALGKGVNLGAGILLGMREAGKSCPDSYLGYECYADQEPETEYKFNSGALLHLAYKRAILGARLTGESSQVIVGISF